MSPHAVSPGEDVRVLVVARLSLRDGGACDSCCCCSWDVVELELCPLVSEDLSTNADVESLLASAGFIICECWSINCCFELCGKLLLVAWIGWLRKRCISGSPCWCALNGCWCIPVVVFGPKWTLLIVESNDGCRWGLMVILTDCWSFVGWPRNLSKFGVDKSSSLSLLSASIIWGACSFKAATIQSMLLERNKFGRSV